MRERILLYLNYQSKLANRQVFRIPYNREELAGYLCVNRSSMSKELSKMQQEGMIRYHKNEFEIFEKKE